MKNERFFGLHFDFHAGDDAEIGVRTEQSDIEWYIRQANPDFIQSDSKGHPGISSYPTKIGRQPKHLVKDNMKIWSETAKKYDLPLYAHHSGIFDMDFTAKHPDQAQCDEDGTVTQNASLFGNYAEAYLIPSIKEMIDLYDIAGVWMDGECWALYRDFSKLAAAVIPKDATNEDRDAIMRKAFVNYLKKCGDELHRYKPDFKYISNWAYSSYMPEKPLDGVLDSLSGDYPSTDSMHVARYEGRCLAAQNKPWDLMCWSWMQEWGNPDLAVYKSEAQLKQEAATVLMLGGGFQLYITQNRDGSARRMNYLPIKELADFVHARRMLFKKKTLAQVGIYYSATSRYHDSRIYNASGATESLIGTVNCILSAQYTANIVLEYQQDTLSDYGIVVIPGWAHMSDDEKKKLTEYAENGGNLVVIGAETASQMGKLCGFDFGEVEYETDNTVVTPSGDKGYKKIHYICGEDGGFEQVGGDFIDLKSGDEKLFVNCDLRDSSIPAYRIENYGKGKIAFLAFDLGLNYFKVRTQRRYKLLKRIFAKLAAPEIDINKTNIDISVLKDDGGIIINLLNMHQNRNDIKLDVFDEVPSIHDIVMTVNGECDGVQMPLGESFEYESVGGKTVIKISKLDIHSIIEVKGLKKSPFVV